MRDTGTTTADLLWMLDQLEVDELEQLQEDKYNRWWNIVTLDELHYQSHLPWNLFPELVLLNGHIIGLIYPSGTVVSYK